MPWQLASAGVKIRHQVGGWALIAGGGRPISTTPIRADRRNWISAADRDSLGQAENKAVAYQQRGLGDARRPITGPGRRQGTGRG